MPHVILQERLGNAIPGPIYMRLEAVLRDCYMIAEAEDSVKAVG